MATKKLTKKCPNCRNDDVPVEKWSKCPTCKTDIHFKIKGNGKVGKVICHPQR
ncbi:MAG: hypothetical protein LiPW31_273 [Microgenomates group bacterium LiPW_31]|nr:MAG: hypothetical protein LiPW31_273 [Microgenomates group bacterium LiPW_31]